MSAKQQQKFFLSECSYKLYYILQFCGFATFTYTSEKGFHMRFYNYLSFIFFTAFYTTLAYLGISRELVIEAKGYQALLFYIGMRFFSYYAILDILFMVISAYLGKRKIFGLFEDYLTMENDVSNISKTDFFSWIKLNKFFLHSSSLTTSKRKMKSIYFATSWFFVCCPLLLH